MGKSYDTWDNLFAAIENDMGNAMFKVSKQVVEVWQALVRENFYEAYDQKMYKRTHETLDSIRLMDISKSSDGYEIMIGYDESQIHTYEGNGSNIWDTHSTPSEMGELVEYGWKYSVGEKTFTRKGAHAFEDMLEYVKSDKFYALFSAEMKKLGYDIKHY